MPDFDAPLRASYQARPLSRTERRELQTALDALNLDPNAQAALRAACFDLARQDIAAGSQTATDALDWLEAVLKLTVPAPTATPFFQATFSPGDGPRNAIAGIVRSARRSLDICVFTISDDYLTEILLDAHARGLALRILTDNDKSGDSGSDILRLVRAGIAVREDATDAHMHHKFAIADSRILLSGSYNWTRSAADRNQENILVTDNPEAARAYQAEFNRLWERMSPL